MTLQDALKEYAFRQFSHFIAASIMNFGQCSVEDQKLWAATAVGKDNAEQFFGEYNTWYDNIFLMERKD